MRKNPNPLLVVFKSPSQRSQHSENSYDLLVVYFPFRRRNSYGLSVKRLLAGRKSTPFRASQFQYDLLIQLKHPRDFPINFHVGTFVNGITLVHAQCHPWQKTDPNVVEPSLTAQVWTTVVSWFQMQSNHGILDILIFWYQWVDDDGMPIGICVTLRAVVIKEFIVNVIKRNGAVGHIVFQRLCFQESAQDANELGRDRNGEAIDNGRAAIQLHMQ